MACSRVMQEQLPSSINHFQHTLNSYKTHHNGIFKNALSLNIQHAMVEYVNDNWFIQGRSVIAY